MDAETTKMLGRPWDGGMGHLAKTCGYLTGAILVLAQAYNHKDEGQAREEVFKAVRELFSRFEKRRGTKQVAKSCSVRTLAPTKG